MYWVERLPTHIKKNHNMKKINQSKFKGFKVKTYNEFYNWYRKNKSILENIPQCMEYAKILLKNIDAKGEPFKLKTKIENHIERNGLAEHTDIITILKKIVKDIDIASLYSKPTAKQNSSEKTQILYAEKRGIELNKLPGTGNKSWRFIFKTGEFKQCSKKEGITSHSMDYICNDGKKYVDYIMGKVITTQGGGQNQQRTEMHELPNAMKLYLKKNPKTNIRFVILMDGDNFDKNGFNSYERYECERIVITNSDNYKPL
jgi:hypothetical protein